MDEDNLSWVKLINNGQKVVINRIHGFLPMKMVQFLTNIHAFPHSFYLSRHGQSEYNKFLKIGGDSGLTELGEQYVLPSTLLPNSLSLIFALRSEKDQKVVDRRDQMTGK